MTLEKRFDIAAFNIYKTAKLEVNYNATFYLKMLTDIGGLATAKRLINSDKQSDGFTTLYMEGRLDLTLEAMIVENREWHELFTSEELLKAKCRLVKNGYEISKI